MNLRDLHYFVVLAETKHFGEASQRCYVSQPTLSMQIKKLEESLGVRLFERTNKQVFLTGEGLILLNTAKKILLLVDELKETARCFSDPLAGELRLGVIPTLAPYLLPMVLPTINRQFPSLKIWLVEEQTQKLIHDLETGELDAAIMALPTASQFAYEVLFEEPFYLVCERQNRLAGLSSVMLTDLADQAILLLAEGHCLRDQTMAVCHMAKANEIADFSATSLETLRLMVQSGMGVTLLPKLATLTHSSEALRYIPFKHSVPSRTVVLCYRTSSPRKQCFSAVAKTITEAVGALLRYE
jgi:LysR family hydrogen peroxide-inducible transcriptional activator